TRPIADEGAGSEARTRSEAQEDQGRLGRGQKLANARAETEARAKQRLLVETRRAEAAQAPAGAQNQPGHTDWVTSVAFSPEGQRLASASNDQTIKIWDAANGQPILSLRGHTDRTSSVAFGGAGRHLVSGSADQTVKVWEGSTGHEILCLRGHADRITGVA